MHLEWLDESKEVVSCRFEDAVEATVMRGSVEGELEAEERREFVEDIDAAYEDPDHIIEINVPYRRLGGAVVRHLRHRADRFGARSVVDYDRAELDYDPTNRLVEHRVEPQAVTIMADQIDEFLGQHTEAP